MVDRQDPLPESASAFFPVKRNQCRQWQSRPGLKVMEDALSCANSDLAPFSRRHFLTKPRGLKAPQVAKNRTPGNGARSEIIPLPQYIY
jgi:hypothetical protein